MAEFDQITPTPSGVRPLPIDDAKKQSGLNFKVYQDLKSSVHRDLLNKVDLERVATVRDERTRAQVLIVIQDLVAGLQTPMSGRERERLSLEVLDEVFGLGPLEPLLQDPTISDILVNGHNQVYVERGGMLEETNIRFKDNAHLMHIIDKIVSDIGRHVDESSPWWTRACPTDPASTSSSRRWQSTVRISRFAGSGTSRSRMRICSPTRPSRLRCSI